jgi:hypothetical protein
MVLSCNLRLCVVLVSVAQNLFCGRSASVRADGSDVPEAPWVKKPQISSDRHPNTTQIVRSYSDLSYYTIGRGYAIDGNPQKLNNRLRLSAETLVPLHPTLDARSRSAWTA